MTNLRPGPEHRTCGNSRGPTSRRFLPPLVSAPPTLLDWLAATFPHVPRADWEARIARRDVTLSNGCVVEPTTPYLTGETVHYQREVDCEPEAPESETILYEDAHIVVADKPHGMPVTPAGEYLERTLLVRLQRRTGNFSLAPAHRLDRDTAGVVLFVTEPGSRAAYHQLFAEGRVEREYRAVARMRDGETENSWTVENRLGEGEPWFRRQVVEGIANATTEIQLLRHRHGIGVFRIRPRTGKKHQIRVHMASIGYPILGDRLYPDMVESEDSGTPLQLLAWRLRFPDPVSGGWRRFESRRRLAAVE